MLTATHRSLPYAYWSKCGIHEYLLSINAGDELYNRMQIVKQDLRQYGVAVDPKTETHITIASFSAKEEMEETLIKWMQRICSQLKSFKVCVNSFIGLPPDTIYTRVQNPSPLQNLVEQLKVIDSFLRSSSCPPLQLINKPHLTIATQLTRDVYDKATKLYEAKTFHESFIVNEVNLFKRSNPFDSCKRVNVFRLLP